MVVKSNGLIIAALLLVSVSMVLSGCSGNNTGKQVPELPPEPSSAPQAHKNIGGMASGSLFSSPISSFSFSPEDVTLYWKYRVFDDNIDNVPVDDKIVNNGITANVVHENPLNIKDSETINIHINDDAVYSIGYLSFNSKPWVSYELSGDFYKGSKWIKGEADANVKVTLDDLNLKIPEGEQSASSDYNYALIYSCSLVDNAWDCHGSKWQLHQFKSSVVDERINVCNDGQCKLNNDCYNNGAEVEDSVCNNGVWVVSGNCAANQCSYVVNGTNVSSNETGSFELCFDEGDYLSLINSFCVDGSWVLSNNSINDSNQNLTNSSNPCSGLGEDDCVATEACDPVYGPSYCVGEGLNTICSDDRVFKSCSQSFDSIECVEVYKPVCGVDGKTYGNSCSAAQAGVPVAYEGECGSPSILNNEIRDPKVNHGNEHHTE